MRRIAILLASLFLTLLGLSPVHAHAELLSMSPQPGSTVTETLQEISLTFGEDVQAMGSTVVVLDSAGSEVQSGMTITGPQVSVTLGDLSTVGEYTVNYRINSSDGHIIEGSQAFTYNGPVSVPIAIATFAGTEEEGEGEEGSGLLTGGLVAVLVLGALAYFLGRRKTS